MSDTKLMTLEARPEREDYLNPATREEAPAEAVEEDGDIPWPDTALSNALHKHFSDLHGLDNEEASEEVYGVLDVLKALRAQPPAREDAQPMAWSFELATVRDRETGEYSSWSEPRLSFTKPCVPEGSIRNLTALGPIAHPAPDAQPVGWLRAVDEEMVCAHLGVAEAEDSYETAKKKLASLIQWNIAVAMDPSIGGEVRAAVSDIAAERQRQVDAEGWSADRDDGYADAELAKSAAAYTLSACGFSPDAAREMWPRSWSAHWWKPTTARRDLVKAGALIVAEIERLDRQALAALKAGA